MNSTRTSSTRPPQRACCHHRTAARLPSLLRPALLALLAAATLLVAGPAHSQPTEVVRPQSAEIPRPPELERDVRFWVRVYTEVTTDGGFLHDEHNLGVVYETLRFETGMAPRDRQRIVDEARDRTVAALRRIATADGPLSPEDQRIRDMWGDEGTPLRLLEAAYGVRFQLGQANRFREGLVRSGTWETHIAETLANRGLPAEIAALPHVESSFNPAAYSKVAAAGLWQFMRSTGRRYLRIDGAVDERMDPFRSTEAAAQLLSYNYRLLGSWPLALTAYNHGAAGMRRARDTMGTDDIVQIVRHYKSPTFGFASRNFYVSFLAALEVDRNAEKYFGNIERAAEGRFHEVEMPAFVPAAALERVVKVDRATLRSLNPALLAPVWDGSRYVPRGYRLRLPAERKQWTAELLAQRLSPRELFAAQPGPRTHRVQQGETLAGIAAEYGYSERTLARLNKLKPGARLKAGRRIRLPEEAPRLARVEEPPTLERAAVTDDKRAAVTDGRRAVVADAGAPRANNEPVADVGDARGVARAVAAAPTGASTATPDGTASAEPPVYVVRRGDSLTEIAAKAGVSAGDLLRINGIRDPNFIYEGQRLALGPVGGEGGATAPATARSGGPAGGAGADDSVAEREVAADVAATVAAARPSKREPVSAAQAEALGPSLVPGAQSTALTDPVDYSVGKDGTIVIAAAETLGHVADWLQVSPARLRTLNKLKAGRPVFIGSRLRLDFGNVSRDAFEQRRREYHRALQANYFAAHRIVGTEVYIARRGDTAWAVTQRFSGLPVWLLQQYNPDVDLAEMRAGTQIVVPRVETGADSGG